MTADDLILDLQEYFPEITETQWLKVLNYVHADLCRSYRLRTGLEQVAVISGQQLYTLPAGVADVFQATWYNADQSWYVLQPTTVATLDNLNQGWRSYLPSQPTQYFTDGATKTGTVSQIGFFTAPSQTTSGSFPIVQLDVSYYETLTGASQMPPSVPQYDAWFYDCLERQALKVNDARLKYFHDMKDAKIAELNRFVAKAQGQTDRSAMVIDTFGARKV